MPSPSNRLPPGFEWFVAWRHLRDPERRSRRMLMFGVAVLALSLIAFGVAWYFGRTSRDPAGFLAFGPPLWVGNLRMAAIIGVIAGLLCTFLGVLFSLFTVFTAISVFGVFLGTAAPVIFLSVMSGFEADLKGKIRGAKADVVITKPGPEPFTEWADLLARVRETPGVIGATPYLEAELIIRNGATPSVVVLRGIDPDTAPSVFDLARTLREGKVADLKHPAGVPAQDRSYRLRDLDQPDEEPGGDEAAEPAPAPARTMPTILLGEELYRTLRVIVGDPVDLACALCNLGPTGDLPRLRPFRVAGHFYSGMYEYDSKLAYISLAEAQRFLSLPGEVTGIDLRLRDPNAAIEVASVIAKRLGPGYDVRSWQELNRGLFGALRLEKIAMFVVLTFIALVASFSIISNLIMMVTEKGREVAILKSMGAGDGAILRIFFAEGLYIGLLGLIVGVASGVLTCVLIERYGLPLPTDVYYISNLPVVMRPEEIGTVAALALALCCLATLYPAVVASRMRPVEGLRYE
jgi:lipoprotein-releasing system permease protein